MGRKKIKIEPIKDERNRHVTFNKRKSGLIKKAMELSILCNCQISLVIFNSENQLYEYCSTDPRYILQRYCQVAHLQHERLTNTDYPKFEKSMTGGDKGKSPPPKQEGSNTNTNDSNQENEFHSEGYDMSAFANNFGTQQIIPQQAMLQGMTQEQQQIVQGMTPEQVNQLYQQEAARAAAVLSSQMSSAQQNQGNQQQAQQQGNQQQQMQPTPQQQQQMLQQAHHQVQQQVQQQAHQQSHQQAHQHAQQQAHQQNQSMKNEQDESEQGKQSSRSSMKQNLPKLNTNLNSKKQQVQAIPHNQPKGSKDTFDKPNPPQNISTQLQTQDTPIESLTPLTPSTMEVMNSIINQYSPAGTPKYKKKSDNMLQKFAVQNNSNQAQVKIGSQSTSNDGNDTEEETQELGNISGRKRNPVNANEGQPNSKRKKPNGSDLDPSNKHPSKKLEAGSGASEEQTQKNDNQGKSASIMYSPYNTEKSPISSITPTSSFMNVFDEANQTPKT